jgi:hypothetical protein
VAPVHTTELFRVEKKSTMAPSSKKRKEENFTHDVDDCALENATLSAREMHLQKMEGLIENLRANEAQEDSKTFEALVKGLWKETKELCETNPSNKSLKAIVSDLVNFGDNFSEDETPIESIKDEKEKRWESRFRELREFRRNNGTCRVPGKENQKLVYWIQNQRTWYDNTITGKAGIKLKPERILKLDSLGFNWGTKHFSPLVDWNGMHAKLVEYKNRFGNCKVPLNPTNPSSLAKWVAFQRKEYRRLEKGRDSLLTNDQIQKLNDVGMNWDGPKL